MLQNAVYVFSLYVLPFYGYEERSKSFSSRYVELKNFSNFIHQ